MSSEAKTSESGKTLQPRQRAREGDQDAAHDQKRVRQSSPGQDTEWPNPHWIAAKLSWPCLSESVLVIVACGSFNPPTNFHMHIMEHARDFARSMGLSVLGGLMSPVHDDYRSRKPSLLSAEHRVEMVQSATDESCWIQTDRWEVQQQGYSRTLVTLTNMKKRMQGALKLIYDIAALDSADLETEGFSKGYLSKLSEASIPSLSDVCDAFQITTEELSLLSSPKAPGALSKAFTIKLHGFRAKSEACLKDSVTQPPDVRISLNCGQDLLLSMLKPGVWIEAQLHELLSHFPIICHQRDEDADAKADLNATSLADSVAKSPILSLYADSIWITTTEIVNNMSSSLIRKRLLEGTSIQFLVPDGVFRYIKTKHPYTEPKE